MGFGQGPIESSRHLLHRIKKKKKPSGPFATKGRVDTTVPTVAAQSGNINAETAAAALATPNLAELCDEIFDIVQQFGSTPEDQASIAEKLNSAMSFNDYAPEIPTIAENGHTRVHDAPRLREIRKRIDNNSCTPMEIESIATEMLLGRCDGRAREWHATAQVCEAPRLGLSFSSVSASSSSSSSSRRTLPTLRVSSPHPFPPFPAL